VLVDPKRVEMAAYERLPHILTPPVVDPKKAIHALAWAIREMEQRYELFARARVRNLKATNEAAIPKDRLPHIVIVVDELADLMMTSPKEVEDYICRLAQMARATGIHLILATQRPSVNVITGLIKANIPARVAFTLPSQADPAPSWTAGGRKSSWARGHAFLSPVCPNPSACRRPGWTKRPCAAGWSTWSPSSGSPSSRTWRSRAAGASTGRPTWTTPCWRKRWGSSSPRESPPPAASRDSFGWASPGEPGSST
jgi:S-DNA-T family DNA segregation ATPase FtsK/SpoIIIE